MVLPVLQGAPHEKQLLQVQQRPQVQHTGFKGVHVDEIAREVQFGQELAGPVFDWVCPQPKTRTTVSAYGATAQAGSTRNHSVGHVFGTGTAFAHVLQAFDERDVVQGQVQVPQLLEVVQVLNFPNDVVLQVQDLELAAQGPHRLNLFDLHLVQA